MIVQLLTTLSLAVNVGYQIPQLILLASTCVSSDVPPVSGAKPKAKKALIRVSYDEYTV